MVIMVPALTFTTPAESAGVGNHAFTTPAESAGVGDGLYGYVCRLPIHNYGFHNSGDGAGGAGSTGVEETGGRLHNCGWAGGKHSHTTHPQYLLIQQVL